MAAGGTSGRGGRSVRSTCSCPYIEASRSSIAGDDGGIETSAERGRPHTCRSTIIFLISAIALAGLRCLGQALAQFMMVWQR